MFVITRSECVHIAHLHKYIYIYIYIFLYLMQVPPQARAGGGEAKQHLETKQEDCARDGQIGWAGVCGVQLRTRPTKAEGCAGEGAKPQLRGMQMRGREEYHHRPHTTRGRGGEGGGIAWGAIPWGGVWGVWQPCIMYAWMRACVCVETQPPERAYFAPSWLKTLVLCQDSASGLHVGEVSGLLWFRS